jgi:hypothetical protein
MGAWLRFGGRCLLTLGDDVDQGAVSLGACKVDRYPRPAMAWTA